jgi:anti-sigma-K factor RskA
MTPEEREELLAAYALGTLHGPEAAEVEELVRVDGTAARDLAAYHEMVDLIALGAPLRRADPGLRQRVLDEARWAVRRRAVATWSGWRVAAAAAAAVGVIVVGSWGYGLQQEVRRQSETNAALAAVVEANAKHIEQLTRAGVNVRASEDLRAQLQNAVADQELVIAIGADPNVSTIPLEATPAGHGAKARYLWSGEVGAGVLVARGLPDLPLDSVYQIWFDDGSRTFSVGTFTPDERSSVQKVVRLPQGENAPVRVLVSVAPVGGSFTPGRLLVLAGTIEQPY